MTNPNGNESEAGNTETPELDAKPSEPESSTKATSQREFQTSEYSEKRRRVREKWYSLAQIPARYRKRPDRNRCEKWTSTFDRLSPLVGNDMMVMLCGKRGTGKTQLACSLIAHFCAYCDFDRFDMNGGRPALYTRALDMFLCLRSFRKDFDERAAFAHYAFPELLVIDEVQVRGETEWEDRMLTSIIDARYADVKSTILISNLDRSEALQSIGPSIASRMEECGGVIVCDWQSFRGKGGGDTP